MTGEIMSLRDLLEKSADADVLREMIGFAAARLTEMEVSALRGAAFGEKSGELLAQRNGYRDRDWQTRAGTAALIEALDLVIIVDTSVAQPAGALGKPVWIL